MNARDWFRVIAKEVRAVASVWVASALAMTAVNVSEGSYQYLLRGIGYAAFFVGPSAVGALAFGHDFIFGTWPMLLTLPISRRRLLVTKFGVVAVLLFLLTVIGSWLGPVSGPPEMGRYAGAIPIVLGAFVAPWLTLQTRRAIAGLVFAVALPGLLLILGLIVGTRLHSASVGAVVAHVVFWGVSIACIAGAFLGWRRFTTLELVDGATEGRAAARSRVSERRPAVTRGNPVWNLFAKELRLQRLTLAMGAFYAVAYVAGTAAWGHMLNFGVIVGVITIAYGCLLAMVAGAVASAEERQLGTLDEQLLLPISVWKQWWIKAVTALGIGVAVGYGLPWLLVRVIPPPHSGTPGHVVEPTFAGIALALAAVSLYVSSVCRTTLAALMSAFPVYVAIAILFSKIGGPVTYLTFGWVHGPGRTYFRYGDPFGIAVVVVLVGCLTMLVARLALSNHRYADRSLLRIAAHAALFVVALTGALAVFGALGIR